MGWGSGGGGGSGSVATDTLWDAAGDLAVGSGADTAARLAKGSNGQVLTVTAGAVGWGTGAAGADKLGLTPTAEKTVATYTAVAGDLVPVDTTSNAVAVTLPTTPADGSVVAVTFVTQGSTNNVTINAGHAGAAAFNKIGGSTTITLSSVPSARLFQYQSTGDIWHVIASRTVSPVPIADGGTGQATALAARAASGLNIESLHTVADADYTILATDRDTFWTSITAARIGTLPAASTLNPGQRLVVGDLSGSLSATITITLTRAGSDTINGATTEVISSPYGHRVLVSDGVSKWTFDGGIARLTVAQTLTNKTFTSPVLNTGVSGTAIDTDSTMTANSDTILASQKAVKTALSLHSADYGDGSDGDVTISTTVTPTRDMYYDHLTIASGGILEGPYRIYAKTSIDVQSGGTIRRNGNNASANTPGGVTSAGAHGFGAAGGATSNTTGTNGGTSASPAAGGSGGAGGAGSGGAAGTGGVATLNASAGGLRTVQTVSTGHVVGSNTAARILGGAGGGGGGGTGAAGGGGGGGGGGVVILVSPTVTNSGTISANGGTGGNASVSGGGGGGGGGGGVVFIVSAAFTGTTPTVTAGGAGTGNGAGSAGSAGSAGTVLVRNPLV